MTIDSSQKKRSSCEKLMQMMKKLLKFSSFPLPVNDVRSSSSYSTPRRNHPPEKHQKPPNSRRSGGLDGGSFKIQGNDHHESGIADEPKASFTNLKKQPEHQKPPNGRQLGGLDGGNIKIQGNDHHEIGRGDELKASVTNLEVSDYIRRFHERNQHDSVRLVLPPPPPPLPPRL